MHHPTDKVVYTTVFVSAMSNRNQSSSYLNESPGVLTLRPSVGVGSACGGGRQIMFVITAHVTG